MTQFKVCSCNRTMPLDAASGASLGAALGSPALPVHSQLCRREVGSYLESLDGVDQVVVACTQESGLFNELAAQKQTVSPVRFVNIRETGGWGEEARQSLPKMAALLAAAALPDPEPVPEVDYESGGNVLLIGPAARVLPWAKKLGGQVEVSMLLTAGEGLDNGGEPLLDRLHPTFSGGNVRVEGWLGAFKVRWDQLNPIDLEICTRCNACIKACPEGAIDLSYQINLSACTSHGECVKACGPIGAIDFDRLGRTDSVRSGDFDLVFDLQDTPAVRLHQAPQGYFAPGADPLRQAGMAMQLTQMVGQFSKPKFFVYKEKICAHGRNRQTGCNACIEVCSAEAISHDGDRIKVNPHLCAGCGACTTVCPSGALTYAYPRPPDMGLRIRTLLDTYLKAGGKAPMLLFHGHEDGADLIAQLGRLAGAGSLRGMPARILPVSLHHIASVGMDVWLSAFCFGASNVAVLLTGTEAPQYADALVHQMSIAQTILSSLGYEGRHLDVLRASDAMALDTELRRLRPAQVPPQRATFRVTLEKRTTLDFAFEHLLKHAPAAKEEIALPAPAPFGKVAVNTSACTLCMSCVGACPEAALADNPNLPQLRFIEKNCVQCGLCEKTCPENAISLAPRLLLTPAAKQPVVLNEAQPYHCIRCSKPFGTLQMIENMVAKLALHGAFAGNIDRIRMCGDCRVVDMMQNKAETSILELKR
jgi:ferredoxin